MGIIDLDVLRPESNYVKINGNDIDVSFIPCAITYDIDLIVQELLHLSSGDGVSSDPEKVKKAFDLSIKLCSTFCEHLYPELDYDYFMNNCDVNQIRAFTEAIKSALTRAYTGIDINPKNLKAPKKKTRH